jgi:hypothetical protein
MYFYLIKIDFYVLKQLSDGNRSIETLEAIDYYLAHHYDQFLSKVVHRLIIDLDIGKL